MFVVITFTVADAYLFTLESMGTSCGARFNRLKPFTGDYLTRIAQRPNVHSALVTEGLIKEVRLL